MDQHWQIVIFRSLQILSGVQVWALALAPLGHSGPCPKAARLGALCRHTERWVYVLVWSGVLASNLALIIPLAARNINKAWFWNGMTQVISITWSSAWATILCSQAKKLLLLRWFDPSTTNWVGACGASSRDRNHWPWSSTVSTVWSSFESSRLNDKLGDGSTGEECDGWRLCLPFCFWRP